MQDWLIEMEVLVSPDEHNPYIARISDDARAGIVRNILADDRAGLVSWSVRPIHGGASGSAIYMVSGSARSHGVAIPWRFVLKVFSHAREGWNEGSSDPVAWNYWKREWLIYRSRWVSELPGLLAPHCYGSGEIGETAAWVAMEDLSRADHRPWPFDRFAACARDIGEFNARIPFRDSGGWADRWLSRGWLRGWTEQSASMVWQLPSVTNDPVVADLFPTSRLDLLLRVWEHRRNFFEALDGFPHSLAHNDVYPRNAFINGFGETAQTIAIDWALSGWAPLGADLAPLVGASLTFFEADPQKADDLERLCMDAYVKGLRQTGLDVRSDDVYVSYLVTIVMRYMVGACRPVIELALDPSLSATFEEVFARPRSAIVAGWRDINAFLESRTTSVLDIFGYY